MTKRETNHITSSTISWENTEDILSVVTKILQTEIQVRLYHSGNLISGRIWPMSEQQKQELYSILYQCIEDWDCDDYTADESDSNRWQFKICTQRVVSERFAAASKPPPHGAEIKKMLAGIIGEENCYFF